MTVWCCVASGPSLTAEDVDQLRNRVRVLVVNDCYRLAPWADAIYAADLQWWHIHHSLVAPHFPERMWSIETKNDPKNPRIGAQLYGLKLFKPATDNNSYEGLSRVPGVLKLGGLSGYQAINIVAQWGATVVLLLGYDMKTSGGRRHWFGYHPRPLTNADDYEKKTKHFATLKGHGVEIINCSRETALTCFPRMTIEAALAKYAPESSSEQAPASLIPLPA